MLLHESADRELKVAQYMPPAFAAAKAADLDQLYS